MRGKASVWRRTGVLEAQRPRRASRQPSWDLAALSDAELEALLPLAEKQAAAEAEGRAPAWTRNEQDLLAGLAAKAGAIK
ncbi:MAG: hypothetical protein IT429_24880 [Gemmataceae bacterium]|nr:hypothetical protein [Gemmataceae bacterium]